MNGSVFIFSLLFLCSEAVPLPRWVYRVQSCPMSDNVTAWQEASKNINCFHDITSNDPLKQAKIYHCLPSTYLNETVEFCGRSVPIGPGNCPIYNYEFWANTSPNSYNCSRFTAGCPAEMYHSKDAYKYSACLKINRVQKCYTADPNCLNYSFSTTQTSTTHVQQLNSSSPGTTVTVGPGITFKDNEQNNSGISGGVIVVVILVVLAIIVAVIATACVARRKRILCYKMNVTQQIGPSRRNERRTLLENGQIEMRQSHFENGNSAVQNGACTEPGKSVPMVGDLCKATSNWLYNDLLEDLKKGISKKLVKRIKTRLKDRIENTSDELDNIQDPMDLLEYLNAKYKIFNNLVFLQGLFLVVKEPRLFDRCVEYANARQDEVFYVREQVSSTDHKKVQYVIDCPNISSYKRSELEKLRDMLSTLIQAQFDDVIVAGIEEGCVIVTFMIRKCLIQNLRSFYSDKTSKKYMAYRWMMKLPLQYRVVKVIIEDEIVYAPDDVRNVDNLTGEAQLATPVDMDDLPECSTQSNKVNETENVDEKEEHPQEVSEESLGNPTCTENLHVKGSEDGSSKLSDITRQSLALEGFLEQLSGSVTDDILQAMKSKLHEFIEHDLVKTMNTNKLFRYLMDKLCLRYNMCVLDWLFEKPLAPHLSERCRTFSSEHQFQLTSFCADTSELFWRECLKFHIMVVELETFGEDIYNLRFWIAKNINVHPGEIIMTELQNDPVIATYMLKEKHVDHFMEFIQTDDGRIEAARNRIEKICHNGKFTIIGKALNGSTFMHIRMSFTQEAGSRYFIRYGSQLVRNAVSHILRESNLPMQGTEAYVRARTSDSLKKEFREQHSARDAIRKNWNHLKGEIEPQMLLKSNLHTFFDEIDIQKVLSSEGIREEQVEQFLKRCLKLPDIKLDKVWKLCLERFCKPLQSDMKEVSKDESLELESTKQWIISNWELLLDEIDSDFMETTLKDMKNVPYDVCNSWSTKSGKSRKERAQMFLEFVLEKHDCLKALAKTLQEYELTSMENMEC